MTTLTVQGGDGTMQQLVSLLTRLYTAAIGFLIGVVFALCMIAALAEYVAWLVVLLALTIVLRIVWTRTSL